MSARRALAARAPRTVLLLSLLALGLLLPALHGRFGVPLPLGTLLDPRGGVLRGARHAMPSAATGTIAGLDGPVTVLRDLRAVPHIFAASDRDAVRALGYVVAQDRLFQMDFIARVASGRLAEVLGPDALETDAFLRHTGMRDGAARSLAAIDAAGGIERDVLHWYSEGVNAYLRTLRPEAVPLELRLFGATPEPWSPLKTLLLLQYMAYDLSFSSDDPDFTALRGDLGAVYDTLFPAAQPYAVPIVRAYGGGAADPAAPRVAAPANLAAVRGEANPWRAGQARLAGTLGEGFRHGKGSNNWAVAGARSATGFPILAGDMHLSLSLPAIWYEVHLATPTMNVYGVTIPGAPLPVEAFNDHVAWTFTNTGSDQIDHFLLRLDPARTRYAYNGGWRPLTLSVDTLRARGGQTRLDTVRWSHYGPILEMKGQTAVAIRWTAHEASHTMGALWGMVHATSAAAFAEATRRWDTPMQNILVASRDEGIAIRSTGYLPTRAGGTGEGLLDGSTDRFAWTGRVPFEALPHSANPARGYLTSTNQRPAGAGYPYYLGHDWGEVFRSRRIDSLLRGTPKHTRADLQRYQRDQHAGQIDALRPLLGPDASLAAPAEALRQRLAAWDGAATVDRPEPLALRALLRALRRLAWDEPAFANGRPSPADAQLLFLLRDAPALSVWDVRATAARERGADLVRRALGEAADTLAAQHPGGWLSARWGDAQKVVFRHLTRAAPLRPFWRGPYPYGGFEASLSPATAPLTTHSASWRMVVDFAEETPQGFGVYPGGQSGDPTSPHYADFLPAYLAFELHPLYRPATADAFDAARIQQRLTLQPAPR